MNTAGSADPDPELQKAVLEEISHVAGDPVASVPSSGEEPAPVAPKWLTWGHLDAACIPADKKPYNMTDDAVQVFAVHPPGGATVCLVNRSEQKVRTRVSIRLPRGVYKIERLVFSPSGSEATPADNAGSPDIRPAAPRGGKLETLEGSDFSRTATVSKLYALEPGQICLYRFTDVAQISWQAWCDTQNCLGSLARTAPSTARRLRRMLNEEAESLGGLKARQGGSAVGERRLGAIHRLLLRVAQAQALAENLQERHTIDRKSGKETLDSLEHLFLSLSETSATALGLVPQTVVAPEGSGPAVSMAVHTRREEMDHALVTVSLANTGSQSVRLVKIGLDLNALAPGALCEPAEPAFFGTLRPGQTVRALFHVSAADLPALVERQCVGDISYFSAEGPAHLRPRPW